MKEFPKPISYKKLFGPSFIILALGLGSGEVILWPYLAANYGLGIAWGALLGITFQFFINMEIERYALVKGESVFVGIARIFPWAVYWFIFSTFIGFGLPGIVAASAQVIASIFGLEQFTWIAIALLIVIGITLSVGKTVYGMMEKITKTVLLGGVPFIFIITIMLSTQADWHALFSGFMGRGDGYWFLPADIAIATFLAAFAYSGAGGNLNLTQSIYVKEKGYGMGKYAQKIVGLFHKKEKQVVTLTGESFALTSENIARYKTWWRMMNIEHALVFLLMGSISMALLMVLAFATTYGAENNAQGIAFVVNEGRVIGETVFPFLGTLFLGVVAVMLFQTQLGVMDSTSRIMAENVIIARLRKHPKSTMNLSRIYAYFVWAQIAFGITLFACKIHEPKTLIVLGAVCNAIAMFVHVGLVSLLNYKSLPKVFQPNMFRRAVMVIIFMFFGVFSTVVVWDKLGWNREGAEKTPNGEVGKLVAQENSGAMWKTYTSNEYGFSFSYPSAFTITVDNIHQEYINHPQGFDWYRIELVNTTALEKPTLRFEVDPDGYGPFFPDTTYEIVENTAGGIVISGINKNVRAVGDDDEVLITTSIDQASNGHAYSWMFSFEEGGENHEAVFQKILATFEVAK